MTTIISGFSGIGKTYYAESHLGAHDLDSSWFSKQENWPYNYYKAVYDLSALHVRTVLVSTHTEVKRYYTITQGLLNYAVVYPDKSLKDEYLERYLSRDNSGVVHNPKFQQFMSDNWDEFIDLIDNDTTIRKIKLQSGQYLSDVMHLIQG